MTQSTAITDFRLAAGSVSAGTIGGSTNYAIVNFPLQADMGGGRIWMIWSDKSEFFHYQRLSRYADGITRPDGYLEAKLILPFVTENGLTYLDTLMSWSNSVWSSAGTIQTVDPRNEIIVVQCTIDRPDPLQLERSERGYRDVPLVCTLGTAV